MRKVRKNTTKYELALFEGITVSLYEISSRLEHDVFITLYVVYFFVRQKLMKIS